jgi:transportin-3
MANKTPDSGGFAPVLAALETMQSTGQGKEKAVAHEFLEKFQKSVRSFPRAIRHTL